MPTSKLNRPSRAGIGALLSRNYSPERLSDEPRVQGAQVWKRTSDGSGWLCWS